MVLHNASKIAINNASKIFLITVITPPILPLAALVLKRYPQTSALAVIIWLMDQWTHGAVVFFLLIAGFLLGLLVRDAYRWLTRSQAIALPPTPRELEDGTATPLPEPPQWLADAISVLQPKWPNDKFEVILREANPCSPAWRVKCLDCPGKLYVPGPGETLSNFEVHLKNRMHRQRADDRMVAATPLPAAEGAGADAEVPAESAKAIVISKIVCVVACTSYVASQFYSSGVVSLEKPLLANVAAMLLYLLRGLEVIFVGFLVLLFAACIQKMRAAAPASPPVLFDDGAATAAEVAAAVEEKGNKDAENASA